MIMASFQDFILPFALLGFVFVGGIVAIVERRASFGIGGGRIPSNPLFRVTLKGSSARILGAGCLVGSGTAILLLAACLVDGSVDKGFVYGVTNTGVFSGFILGFLFAAAYAVYDFLR